MKEAFGSRSQSVNLVCESGHAEKRCPAQSLSGGCICSVTPLTHLPDSRLHTGKHLPVTKREIFFPGDTEDGGAVSTGV